MKQKKGSYLLGIIGAFLGALVAAVPFAIVLYLGYIVFWLAALFVILAALGYDKIGGRQGYGKIPIVLFFSFIGVFVGIFAGDVWYLVTENIMASMELSNFDIPLYIWYVFVEDAEYREGVTFNLALSMLIVLVVGIGYSIRIAREIKHEKEIAAHQEQMALHQEMYGTNQTYNQGGFQNHPASGNGFYQPQANQMQGSHPAHPMQGDYSAQPVQDLSASSNSGFDRQPAVSQDSFGYVPMNHQQPEHFANSGADEMYRREEEVSRPEE